MSLALATLRHEWRRFLPGLLSVTFAGVLMLVQLGLLLGMFGTVTVLVDRAKTDLWISSPETQSVDQAQRIPASLAALAHLNPEVLRTETLSLDDAEWHVPEGPRLNVSLVGMEPDGDALACPEPLRAALCDQLAEPMSVIVDSADLDKLGTDAGQLAEINGHRVRVVAVSHGLRNIGGAYVFASRQTAATLNVPPRSTRTDTSFVLAKLAPGTNADAVAQRLQQQIGPQAFRVWTREGLSASSQRYWVVESGVGAGFLFSCLLGLVIGVVITSQTLRAAVLGSLREYATFRAIGVPARKLGGVVLEQSLWIGGAGILLTLLTSVAIKLLAGLFDITLTLTVWAVVLAALIGLVTAVVSGLMALRELYRLEPAELLR
jgi:putative ABC transport system permease protein